MPVSSVLLNTVARFVDSKPRKWLITGVAGFIGSNILEALLVLDQDVVGLDNFATGFARNLDDVRATVGASKWKRFRLVEGDICDHQTINAACTGIDVVLHQAALGSVPRSFTDPIATDRTNIGGFLTTIWAARAAGVGRIVYAASSSTYGDNSELPKVEDRIGRPLSPYAVTKYANELYADVLASHFGIESVGLRYFNVFGPRQDPNGSYAAVIPRWIGNLQRGEACQINGDGETSRDFCYVDNVIQANILAACVESPAATNAVYNVAYGARTSLNELYRAIRDRIAKVHPEIQSLDAVYMPFREGDIRHSQANIEKATRVLGYRPTHSVSEGLDAAMPWYLGSH